MRTTQRTPGSLHKEVFRSHALLIFAIVLFLAVAGLYVNTRSEARQRDQNLRNVAETTARSQFLTAPFDASDSPRLTAGLDALRDVLANVDVLSVVGPDGVRLYHTNHSLIGEKYEGERPDFSSKGNYYAVDAAGPSGAQRRAYAAIYDAEGQYRGFVLAIMLRKNIRREIVQHVALFSLFALVAVLVELLVSHKISERVKQSLMGYEPDSFSAMYRVRDGVLESLDEGIVATNAAGEPEFVNQAALRLLGASEGLEDADCARKLLARTLETGERETGVPVACASGANVLVDRLPIREGDKVAGAVAILHDRTEYIRLAEDLSGTRFLVDSIRANNHNFTNKLHVILGLIQIHEYDRAAAYIENVAFVQRDGVRKIIEAIEEPSVAALLVGKTCKASELDVKLLLNEGSVYRRSDAYLPAEALVTILGNLIDNALDALNNTARGAGDDSEEKELLVGIYSDANVLLINVDDNGPGIPSEILPRVFEKGVTTKGAGHGVGLYHIRNLTESLGGTIAVESQEGVGTSFVLSFQRKGV